MNANNRGRRSRGRAGKHRTGNRVANRISEPTASRLVIPPNDPKVGSSSVLQTRRTQSYYLSGASTGTVTVAQALANSGLSTSTRFRFKKVLVYFQGTAGVTSADTDRTITVTDALPNNDGLILRDAGVEGATRPCAGYIPSEIDRMTTYSTTSTQSLFSYTGSYGASSGSEQITLVLTLEMRVSL
jgi:hypothetical protein